MTVRPHHVHGLPAANVRAEPFERETAPLAAANAMLELAAQAVRIAVEHGGDAAAGSLRLLLNDLSPMPAPEEPAAAPLGPDMDLRLKCATGAKVLHDMARTRRSPAGAKQLNALGDAFAECAKRLKGEIADA